VFYSSQRFGCVARESQFAQLAGGELRYTFVVRGRPWDVACPMATDHPIPSEMLDLTPLSDPSTTPDRIQAVHQQIRRVLTDPRSLAHHSDLAPDHPLRIAAATVADAFEAVTSGSVSDDQIALAEISRQHPLAPWKMLIRAIAAFYRHDDTACEKFAAAIDPTSAPARIGTALLHLLHPASAVALSVSELAHRTGGQWAPLRAALKRLDSSFKSGRKKDILAQIKLAIYSCEGKDPKLLERLRQHIAVRAMMAEIPAPEVTRAMGGVSIKSAYFWRLLARTTENDKHDPLHAPCACRYWDEFFKHATHEGWFASRGPEAAAIFLHMTDIWCHIDPDEWDQIVDAYVEHFENHQLYYEGQSTEVRALMVPDEDTDRYFLSPIATVARACAADPCSANFARWLRLIEKYEPDSAEPVAERWIEALPNDIPPLLYLMDAVEKRNALQKAFKYMERAERIDAVNSEVRRARLRLLVSIAIRHIKDRKTHLAEKDIVQIESLPQAQHGMRPAFVAALRYVIEQNRDFEQARTIARQVAHLMGGEMPANMLMESVANACGQVFLRPFEVPKNGPMAEALGRACMAGAEMGKPFEISPRYWDPIQREVSHKTFKAAVGPLIALGHSAAGKVPSSLTYAIAGAGLSQGTEGQAHFLYFRATAIPEWAAERRATCLAAASELARRARDTDLLNRIGQWRDVEMEWMGGPSIADPSPMDSEQIAAIVAQETRLRAYPVQPRRSGERFCNCPKCRAAREASMPPGIAEMLEELGPEGMADALAEIIGMGSRKRRRPRSDDTDHF
jgi:hypothetical protein